MTQMQSASYGVLFFVYKGAWNMKDNTIKDSKGQSIDVYDSRIYELCDEYISGLDEKEEIQASMIRKTPIFKGMLKDIYINIFKITDKDIKYNNKNSSIDYSNIDLLNELWDIYTGLCYKYCQNPTILNFSIMTGISMDCFNDWKNNNNRAYIYYDKDNSVINNLPLWKMNHPDEECRRELGTSHSQSVKKWLRECESSAYDAAMSGNPGGMFILKSNYGYVETPQQININAGYQPQSIEQIALERVNASNDASASLEAPPDADF